MGTGSGTEGGQSLIRTVPAGACPHFYDAWVGGTPMTNCLENSEELKTEKTPIPFPYSLLLTENHFPAAHRSKRSSERTYHQQHVFVGCETAWNIQLNLAIPIPGIELEQ